MSKHTELRYPPEQTPLQNLLAALDCIGDGLESDKDKHRAVSEERVEELHDLAVLAEKEHDVLLMLEALEKAHDLICEGNEAQALQTLEAAIATAKEV